MYFLYTNNANHGVMIFRLYIPVWQWCVGYRNTPGNGCCEHNSCVGKCGRYNTAHNSRTHMMTQACSGSSPSLSSGILQFRELMDRPWRSGRRQWLVMGRRQVGLSQKKWSWQLQFLHPGKNLLPLGSVLIPLLMLESHHST